MLPENKSRLRPNWLGRIIRRLTLRHLAAHALEGMLANPAWMRRAQDECARPGCGHDIPDYFGKVAARYAESTLNAVENIEAANQPEPK